MFTGTVSEPHLPFFNFLLTRNTFYIPGINTCIRLSLFLTSRFLFYGHVRGALPAIIHRQVDYKSSGTVRLFVDIRLRDVWIPADKRSVLSAV